MMPGSPLGNLGSLPLRGLEVDLRKGLIRASFSEKTFFVDFPKDNVTIAGKPLRLPCVAMSDPSLKPKITWLLHGQPIDVTNPRYIVEQDNTLRIDGAVGADTGEYTCVAETDHDRVNMTAKIVVRGKLGWGLIWDRWGLLDTWLVPKGLVSNLREITISDVPTPPQNVWVKCDNTTSSADVTFQYIEMSQEVPAREFWVQYNMDENEPNYWETYPTPISHLNNDFGTFRVSLHPYGNFAFRVVARNDVSVCRFLGSKVNGGLRSDFWFQVGDSAPTMGDRRCITPAARPSRNPGKVLVKGNTPEDLTVYWEVSWVSGIP